MKKRKNVYQLYVGKHFFEKVLTNIIPRYTMYKNT